MQVHVHPADSEKLPPDVGAVVHITDDLDIHCAVDQTLSIEARCAYGSTALTAGFQQLLDAATQPLQDTEKEPGG